MEGGGELSPETQGILIGAASIIAAGLLTTVAAQLMRLWHTPKRLDRIETLIPPLLRAIMCLLKNQKAGKCNGTTDATIEELEALLTDQSVSQKANG